MLIRSFETEAFDNEVALHRHCCALLHRCVVAARDRVGAHVHDGCAAAFDLADNHRESAELVRDKEEV